MPDPIPSSALAAAETAGPVRVSIVAQLDPLWRHGRIGEAGITDVKLFAEQMAAYVAQNLERFADPRGADVFVQVVIDRDGESAGHAYRSGHFVKEDAGAAPVTPEGLAAQLRANPQYQEALRDAESESWDGPGIDGAAMIEAANERRRAAPVTPEEP